VVVGNYIDAIASEVPPRCVVPVSNFTPSKATAIETVGWLATWVAKTKELQGGIVWIDEIPQISSG
jgi:hypothetical protein